MGGGSDPQIDCQMRKKGGDFGFSHFVGVALVMEEDESPYPMPVCFFGSEAIVLQTNGGTNLIDEFWRTQGGHLGMCVSLSRKVERSTVDMVDRAL